MCSTSQPLLQLFLTHHLSFSSPTALCIKRRKQYFMTMSPSKFTNFHDPSQHKISSQRPSPLIINKTSHLIHKSSSSLPIRRPIIIYTHSPKIIHTEARDFMALVQKLTGMSQPNDSPSANHRVLDRKHSETQTPSCHIVEESHGVGGIEPDPFISDAPLFTPPASHYRHPSVMRF